MANTLTGLIPILLRAKNTVSREMTGFIQAVYHSVEDEPAAVGQTITYPIVTAQTPAAITPASTGPSPSGQTVSPGTMSISKSYSTSFPWNGEEQVALGNAAYTDALEQQFAESMRAIANLIEVDLAALYIYASRAYGTAGTTPFGTNLGEAAQVLKILKDNGAPTSNLQMVINTTAGAALRTLTQFTDVNRAGSEDPLRRGILLPVDGFDIRESGQISTHTKGTGSGYLVDLTAGYSAGDTAVHVDTGTGTILAGDVLTDDKTGTDTNKYIVGTGFAGDGDGDIALAEPGIQVAAWANNDPLTIGANYTPNLAFDRYAIHLVARPPLMPDGGDAADDVRVVMDPVSGLLFQIALYRQYRQVVYEVACAWGVGAIKSEHIAILLG